MRSAAMRSGQIIVVGIRKAKMRKNWGRRRGKFVGISSPAVRSLNFVILHLLVFPSPSLVASPTTCCSPDLITFKYFRYLFKTHISLLLFTHRKPINQVNKQTKTVGILYILWKRRSTTHKHNSATHTTTQKPTQPHTTCSFIVSISKSNPIQSP